MWARKENGSIDLSQIERARIFRASRAFQEHAVAHRAFFWQNWIDRTG